MPEGERIAELEARVTALEEEVAAICALVAALLGASPEDGARPLGEEALAIGFNGALQRWPEVGDANLRRIIGEIVRMGLVPQRRPKSS